MNKVITAFICFTALQISAAAQTPPLKQVQWLAGTWVMKMKQGTAYETWHIVNDSTFESRSYIVKTNGDTIPQESVKLVCRNAVCYYMPTVPNQNNGQAVSFRITLINSKGFTAENPQHDFPQRIIYLLKSPTSLYASIDGTYNNKYAKEEYNMKRE